MGFAFNTKYSNTPLAAIKMGKYGDGSTSLEIVDEVTGEDLCRATISMSWYGLTPREGDVFIKDYSENEGVFEALKAAGIVGEAVARIDAGYVKAGVVQCKLLIDAESAEVVES